jgi:excisionase family DNA binding protein
MIVIESKEAFMELVREAVRVELQHAANNRKPEKLLTVKETCEILKISSRTLNRMTKDGDIRATKLRGRPAYEESEIQRLLLNKKR